MSTWRVPPPKRPDPTRREQSRHLQPGWRGAFWAFAGDLWDLAKEFGAPVAWALVVGVAVGFLVYSILEASASCG